MSGLIGWIKGFARKHPLGSAALALSGLAGLIVILVWFQPQTLLFDRVVDEEFPQATPTTATPAGEESPRTEEDPYTGEMTEMEEELGTEVEPPMPTGPIAILGGEFSSRNRYTVTGTATVYLLDDGARVLRLEDFASTNGPDLYVYLTAANSADSDAALDMDFVDLGLLIGNIGNQNYPIADDVDLSRYDTVVIWCRRFTVGFGAADLMDLG
jgi:hypothetical protein